MDVHPWMDKVENSCPKNHAWIGVFCDCPELGSFALKTQHFDNFGLKKLANHGFNYRDFPIMAVKKWRIMSA
jgi:hypothetical protein